MTALKLPTMSRCDKLHDLPPVITDWQNAWYPDCEYYEYGRCAKPKRCDDSAACPFNGKALPLREVAAAPNADQPQKTSDAAGRTQTDDEPRSALLAHAIKQQIAQRTGGRIRLLEVAMLDKAVVIRGSVSSYHAKQLALQAVLDVLGSACSTRFELDLRAPRSSAMSTANSQ